MLSSSPHSFRDRVSDRDVRALDSRAVRRAALIAPLAHTKWLEGLRFRFDFAIEVLDPDLEYVLGPMPDVHHGVDVRAALNRTDPALRDTAAAVLRSGKGRSLTTGGLRVRMFPLFARAATPPTAVGILLIAESHPLRAEVSSTEASDALDRRLDATGQWLAAAIEAEIGATTEEAVDARSAQRLAGVIDVIDAVNRMDNDWEIVGLMMEATALWYDADVRVYRQDLSSGAFVLHSCLPGVRRDAAAPQLVGHQIWGREDIFRLESVREIEELGWVGPIDDTLFAPITVEQSTEWLLTVSPANHPSVDTTLGILSRIASARLTELQRDAAERVRRQQNAIFAFGDAPFDATARMALEAVARDTGASSAIMTIYYEREGAPALSVGWGPAAADFARFVEPGTATMTSEAIAVGTAAGAGVTAVLELRGPSGGFSVVAARLARSAAASFGIWLSGALIRRTDVRVPAESEYSAEFVGRLSGHIDRLGRLRIGGAVAVVLPDVAPPSGPLLDDVVQVIQEQVRSSDVVGIVEATGAGVLLPDATSEVASAVVGRLLQAARRQGMAAARVGVATFSASSESPEALLERALINARRGSTLS